MKTRARVQERFSRWSRSIKRTILLGGNENLLDHHQEPRLRTTLSKQDYDKWCGRFFHLESMFAAICILTSLEMYREGMQGAMSMVKREAWAVLLRSAQTHYQAGVMKLQETEVYGIKVTDLRLASHTARELYGTKHLPILGGTTLSGPSSYAKPTQQIRRGLGRYTSSGRPPWQT